MKTYVTSFCNRPHKVKTGYPIRHECYVLNPKALQLEIDGQFDKIGPSVSWSAPFTYAVPGVEPVHFGVVSKGCVNNPCPSHVLDT